MSFTSVQGVFTPQEARTLFLDLQHKLTDASPHLRRLSALPAAKEMTQEIASGLATRAAARSVKLWTGGGVQTLLGGLSSSARRRRTMGDSSSSSSSNSSSSNSNNGNTDRSSMSPSSSSSSSSSSWNSREQMDAAIGRPPMNSSFSSSSWNSNRTMSNNADMSWGNAISQAGKNFAAEFDDEREGANDGSSKRVLIEPVIVGEEI